MKSTGHSLEEMIESLKSEDYQGLNRSYRNNTASRLLIILLILSPVFIIQIYSAPQSLERFSFLSASTVSGPSLSYDYQEDIALEDFEIFEQELLFLEEIL